MRLTNRSLSLASLDEQAILFGLRAAPSQGAVSLAGYRWRVAFYHRTCRRTRGAALAPSFDS
jgi:hypothetical protein